MAYRSNDSGCGCLLILFIVVGIISGIRSCTEHLIDGDLRLPKFGSSHVSGGSGGYGTSNGYNLKYKNTTAPNYNGSLKDYTHTNSQSTENIDNSSNHPSEHVSSHSVEHTSNSSSQIQSHSNSLSTIQNSSPINSTSEVERIISEYESSMTTCPDCNGTGTVYKSWTFYGGSGNPCVICWKSEKHEHINEPRTCYNCMGNGKVSKK